MALALNKSKITMALHNRPSKLRITSKTKSSRQTVSSKEQLRSLIEQELERQGPDADLNFIDVSKIKNMCLLFDKLDIRNIKIDSWDVSKVKNMDYMFWCCEKFKCDLSQRNVSNVDTYCGIFYKCRRMRSNSKPAKFNS